MPTVTVLDDTFSDLTTVAVASRPATVGGSWTAIEVTPGAGVDGARVIGGTGFAYAAAGSSASGNRSGLVLTSADWDVYFDLDRPSNFGGVRLMAGANASGVGGWLLMLSNFSDTIRLFSDSTSFANGGEGPERVNVGHAMPLGASTYQLQKRGQVLRMFRNNVQLGTDWTDPSPTAAPGCVMFWAAQSDNIGISRVWATIEAPDIEITGPSGAAGAASITHAVNELQNNAGTWSATGGTAWSLTGTDASLLAISAGGVVTLASGNFDRETKASYSFNVLRDAVAQAVTLNINNVNEAPTFSGPNISVPGLVVGTPMASINAALLFADPDAGDTGTYSAVGTWPAGVTVNAAGLISGTPSAAGTSSNLRVRRTDVGGLTADSNLFNITVSAASTPVSFAGTVGAQSGTVGTAFGWSGAALASFFSGSLTPFTYNVSAGSLPPGLSLNASTGVVTGTPTTAGTFNATFRAVDTASNQATSNSVAFTIAAAPPPPPAAGFDFHTAAGCVFGAISGSLVGLAREVGVTITPRVYNTSTGALVATLPATATDSNGRLPRLTDPALAAGTFYDVTFKWVDGSAYTIRMAAS